MTENKTVTIETKEYEQLKESQRFLDALYEVGVDNWNGYSDAWAVYEGEESE